MVFICDFCNKVITDYTTLYFGFDCLCCSNHCRSQVIQQTLHIDPTMNNPHTWLIHKLRSEKVKAKQILPKTRSLLDILRQLEM